MANDFKGKQIYVAGNDPTNGGVTTAAWFLNNGAKVVVTGIAAEQDVAAFTRRLSERLKRTARDGKAYTAMLSNISWDGQSQQGVNTLDIFIRSWKKKLIVVTGKYGKSTVVAWAAHILGKAVTAGQSADRPVLAMLGNAADWAIVESAVALPESKKVTTVSTDSVADYLSDIRDIDLEGFAANWGKHNIANLAVAVRAAIWSGIPLKTVITKIASLPQVPHRQEIIHNGQDLTVVDDAAASSPACGLAALERWAAPNCILITGGRDDDYDYKHWAQAVVKGIRPTNLIFLDGSATAKMRLALGEHGRGVRAYDSLAAAWRAAQQRAGKYVKAVILFSPSALEDGLLDSNSSASHRFSSLVREEN